MAKKIFLIFPLVCCICFSCLVAFANTKNNDNYFAQRFFVDAKKGVEICRTEDGYYFCGVIAPLPWKHDNYRIYGSDGSSGSKWDYTFSVPVMKVDIDKVIDKRVYHFYRNRESRKWSVIYKSAVNGTVTEEYQLVDNSVEKAIFKFGINYLRRSIP
ncbi:MAG: hypothetical protein IJ849_09845 [Selenomonadaceae bacterium]|nr:hypothetical protein [Selenomonadaceae bacterium]